MNSRRDRRWLLAALLGTGVGVAAWRREALSSSGAAGAAAVGTAVFGAGGPRASALLLLFFGSSTALSRASRTGARTQAEPGTGRSGPRRTLTQVLANGGVPAALALLSLRARSPRALAAYAAALAAANADTWSTEIGRRGAAPPRMITTGRPAPRGVSGAVTPLGTAASLAGAALIGAAYAALYRAPVRSALAVAAAGALGGAADSLLGATLQAVYSCRACGQRTEDQGHAHGHNAPALTLVRGLPFMTNDTVNLCASLTSALTAAALPSTPTYGISDGNVRRRGRRQGS